MYKNVLTKIMKMLKICSLELGTFYFLGELIIE